MITLERNLLRMDKKICSYCLIDDSFPKVKFDERGRCNYCIENESLIKLNNDSKDINRLNSICNKIKLQNRKLKYDVVVGISGGIDSAYVLFQTVLLGLRPLAVHVDTGWNTEVSTSNINKLCSKLKVDLETIVIDWEAMKELQRAFFLSSTLNIDIPQDHMIFSSLNQIVRKSKVKYMFSGSNVFTEGIKIPFDLGYTSYDYRYIRSVNSHYSRNKKLIKNLPRTTILDLIINKIFIKKINILNYIKYSELEASNLLRNDFNWISYGGKHNESRFTRFFQSQFLIEKYKYDKRVIHLSSLIVNQELDRNDALKKLSINDEKNNPLYYQDKRIFLSKLDLNESDYDLIIDKQTLTYENFQNNFFWIKLLSFLNEFLAKLI
jgi:hypothetical protein